MSAPVAHILSKKQDTFARAGSARDLSTIQRFAGGMFLSIDTDDFDEFRDHARGWSIDHQLHGARKPHSALSGVLTQTLQIAVLHHSMGYRSQGRNPQGTLSISVPLDARPVKYRGQIVDQLQAPLIRGSEGFELVCDSGAQFMILSVAEDKADGYAAEVTQKTLWPRPADRFRFPDSSCKRLYLEALTHLLRTVESNPSLLNDPKASALFEQKALECLPLETHCDSHVAEDRSRYKVARQAYRFLHDRQNVPSIRELCAATGASYATLERGFREMYGMAPKALIQDLKLSRARSALLHPAPSTTVTDVALSVGLLEFGRFSLQYRQRFGELPSETLAKARGIPADS